jgi:hypothetical protein
MRSIILRFIPFQRTWVPLFLRTVCSGPHFGGSAFSWGQKDIVAAGAAWETYLDALHSADAGDIRPVLRFARS